MPFLQNESRYIEQLNDISVLRFCLLWKPEISWLTVIRFSCLSLAQKEDIKAYS